MKKLLLVVGLLIILAPVATKAQVAVVVNKSVNIENIDKSKLSSIYSLDVKKWDNGKKVVVFDQKGSSGTKDKFYGFIGKKYSKMKKIWMKKQLTGEGKAPKGYGSDSDVISKVASTEGAIGFVAAGSVTDQVKVVATIN